MSEQIWWYATRAAGLMTWSTATASVLVGLLLSTRVIRSRTGPWLLDLHRYLGGISVLFLIVHVVTLALDSYVDFGPRELFVPGESTWEPEAVAWGIIAAYVLVAVEVTSLLRSRIRTRVWRVVHLLSFVTVGAGTYHAWLAGSDVHSPVAWAVAGLGSVLVVALVAVRLRRRAHEDPDTPTRFPDQLALLEEMRQRLEDLPIPESTPQPQLTTTGSGALPRRAPVHAAPPADAIPEPHPTEPASAEVGFSPDPFAAVPADDPADDVGSWVDPSAADPFAARPLDPFRHTTSTPVDPTRTDEGAGQRFRSRPFTDAEIDTDDGRDLFDSPPDPAPVPDLFANPPDPAPVPLPVREPVALDRPSSPWPTPPESGAPSPFATPPASAPFEPVREPAPATDLFGHPQPGDPTAVPAGNPFESAAPPLTSLTEPSPAGPPPLPTDAVDPETGEPDEAAYTEWLKDWLAYAERYGDEAPGDPARV